MEGFSLMFSLLGLILGIVLIIAQLQLFAIKKYLHDLLQLQLALHGIVKQAAIDSVAGSTVNIQPLEVTMVQSKSAGA
jgi:hypothetical protein